MWLGLKCWQSLTLSKKANSATEPKLPGSGKLESFTPPDLGFTLRKKNRAKISPMSAFDLTMFNVATYYTSLCQKPT